MAGTSKFESATKRGRGESSASPGPNAPSPKKTRKEGSKRPRTVITPEHIQKIDGKITKYKQQIVELENEVRIISNSNAQEIIMQDNEEKQGSLVESKRARVASMNITHILAGGFAGIDINVRRILKELVEACPELFGPNDFKFSVEEDSSEGAGEDLEEGKWKTTLEETKSLDGLDGESEEDGEPSRYDPVDMSD